jgi:predicted O-methyltransferase YrrM
MLQYLRRLYLERVRPKGYITHLVGLRTKGQVLSGPFRGMKYLEPSFSRVPKLLGIYERELAGVVRDSIVRTPSTVINIGAAEGYYAVGLALALPEAKVIAFEADIKCRQLLSRLALLNACDTVSIHGLCDVSALRQALDEASGTPLVLIDVEGAESELVDLAKIPKLRQCELLIETHDFITPGVTDALASHLRQTHHVETIWQTDRSPADFPFSDPYTAIMPRRVLRLAVSERRAAKMQWLHCLPNQIEVGLA